MSLGLAICGNKPLVEKIQKLFPTGIFSEKDFVEKVEVNITIYAVHAAAEAYGVCLYEYEILFLEKYNPPYKSGQKGMLQYTAREAGRKREGFVSTLVQGPNGCFFLKEEAELYMTEIKKNLSKIVTLI